MKYDEKGSSATAIFAVLIVLAIISFTGWHIWHNKNTKATDSISQTTAPKKAKSSNDGSATDSYLGWKSYTSLSAGYSIKYPSGWNIQTSSGDYEMTRITSPDNFEIDLASFTRDSEYGSSTFASNPTGQCGSTCLSSNKVADVNVSKLGDLGMYVQTQGAGGGSANTLALYLPSGSAYIESPVKSTVYTTISGVYQGRSQQVNTAETLDSFSDSSSVKTAEMVYKSLTY